MQDVIDIEYFYIIFFLDNFKNTQQNYWLNKKSMKIKKNHFLLFFKASTAANFLPASILIQAPPPLLT